MTSRFRKYKRINVFQFIRLYSLTRIVPLLLSLLPFIPTNIFFNSCFLIFPDARSNGWFEFIHVPPHVVNLISPSLISIRILPLKLFSRYQFDSFSFEPDYIFPLIFAVFTFHYFWIFIWSGIVHCESRFFTIPTTEDDS